MQIASFEDGFLHYDAAIMLQSVQTEGYLSVDIFDKVQGTNDSYYPSTKTDAAPHIRSAFYVVPYQGAQDSIVRYGEKVVFRTHPNLIPNEHYSLSSCPLNQSAEARFSKQMEVCLTAQNSYKNVF